MKEFKMNTQHIDSKILLLYLLDELDDMTRQSVKSHLDACPSCMQLMEDEKAWMGNLKQAPVLKPGYRVLSRAHSRLMQALENRSVNKPSSWFPERFLNIFPNLFYQNRLVLAGIVFVCGFFVGHWSDFWQSRHRLVDALSKNQATMVGNFDIDTISDDGNDIELQFSTVERHSVRGNLQNRNMQYLLSYALVHLDQDNVRLKCIELLQKAAEKEMVQRALYFAAQKDENPGVRLKAVRILKNLPLTDPLKDVLVRVFFQDDNSGIRLAAKDALSGSVDPYILKTGSDLLDQDNYMEFLDPQIQKELKSL